MLRVDGPAYLLIPGNDKKRVLHSGKVLELCGDTFSAAFEEVLSLEAGADVVIFFDRNGKFFQQGAKTTQICPMPPATMISFSRVGDMVSAEQRQLYRVSTVTAGILARVDKEKGCSVVDVSPEGLAIISPRPLSIGSVAQIEIAHESLQLVTPGRVQAVKVLPDGRFRHGFLAGEKRSPARKTLEQVTSAMQRQQLARLRVCGAA